MYSWARTHQNYDCWRLLLMSVRTLRYGREKVTLSLLLVGIPVLKANGMVTMLHTGANSSVLSTRAYSAPKIILNSRRPSLFSFSRRALYVSLWISSFLYKPLKCVECFEDMDSYGFSRVNEPSFSLQYRTCILATLGVLYELNILHLAQINFSDLLKTWYFPFHVTINVYL